MHKLSKFLLFFIILLLVILTNSNHMYSRDEGLYFYTTLNIIDNHSIQLPHKLIGPDTLKGKNNAHYSPYPIGQSLLFIPVYLLFKNIIQNKILIAKFFSLIISYLLVIYTFKIINIKNNTKKSILFTILIFISTPLCVYSKTFFTELTTSFFIILFMYMILKKKENLLIFSFIIIFLILLKTINIILIPFIFIATLLNFHHKKKHTINILISTSAGLILTALYNYLRFNNIFISGYMKFNPDGKLHSFITPLKTGLFGLLLSYGKSVFIYFPALILFILLIKKIKKNNNIIIFLLMFFSFILFYAQWIYWEGGFAVWGPRFIIPVINPIIILIFYYYKTYNITQKILLLFLSLFGIIINLPAVIFNYITFSDSLTHHKEMIYQFKYTPYFKLWEFILKPNNNKKIFDFAFNSNFKFSLILIFFILITIFLSINKNDSIS